MGLYSFSYNINGYAVVDVNANSRAEAREQADRIFDEMDFGPLEDIDGYLATIMAPNGDLYYEEEFYQLVEKEEQK